MTSSENFDIGLGMTEGSQLSIEQEEYSIKAKINEDSVTEISQPYAPTYHVMQDMLEYDKKRGVYNGGYDLNPTAVNISYITTDYIISKKENGEYPYVITISGEIIVGKRNGNGRNGRATPHPTLIGGADPQVKVAGMLKLKNGKIFSYDNRSGHFKPNIKSIKEADEAFSKLPDFLFDKSFIRREK